MMTTRINDDELNMVNGGMGEEDDTERVTCPKCGNPFRIKQSAVSGICPDCGATAYKGGSYEHENQKA